MSWLSSCTSHSSPYEEMYNKQTLFSRKNAAPAALQLFTSTFLMPLAITALPNFLKLREGLKHGIWQKTLLANRKDTLLWGPDLGFSFPAAVCGQQLIVSTCLTSGITSGGDQVPQADFFFNGHFLFGVTCMTACDKQKLMGTLLCQYLLNCFDTGCRLPAWPPSQDLTWNVARGPQLYSLTSQLVSD